MDPQSGKPQPIVIGPTEPIVIGSTQPISIGPGPPPIMVHPPPVISIRIPRQPIHLMHEAGVDPAFVTAANHGIDRVLRAAAVPLATIDFGLWRLPNWRTTAGELVRYRSIDHYLSEARITIGPRVDQINPGIFHGFCEHEPWQKQVPHYDVAILTSQLSGQRSPTHGSAVPYWSALISLFHFSELSVQDGQLVIEAITAHEVGHLFGLWPGTTGEARYAFHCPEPSCVMQQLWQPVDWIAKGKALQMGRSPFCTGCLTYLHRYFD